MTKKFHKEIKLENVEKLFLFRQKKKNVHATQLLLPNHRLSWIPSTNSTLSSVFDWFDN